MQCQIDQIILISNGIEGQTVGYFVFLKNNYSDEIRPKNLESKENKNYSILSIFLC